MTAVGPEDPTGLLHYSVLLSSDLLASLFGESYVLRGL